MATNIKSAAYQSGYAAGRQLASEAPTLSTTYVQGSARIQSAKLSHNFSPAEKRQYHQGYEQGFFDRRQELTRRLW